MGTQSVCRRRVVGLHVVHTYMMLHEALVFLIIYLAICLNAIKASSVKAYRILSAAA